MPLPWHWVVSGVVSVVRVGWDSSSLLCDQVLRRTNIFWWYYIRKAHSNFWRSDVGRCLKERKNWPASHKSLPICICICICICFCICIWQKWEWDWPASDTSLPAPLVSPDVAACSYSEAEKQPLPGCQLSTDMRGRGGITKYERNMWKEMFKTGQVRLKSDETEVFSTCIWQGFCKTSVVIGAEGEIKLRHV